MFAWIKSLFSGLSAQVQQFFAGPGGQIVKDALSGAVQFAGAEALGLLTVAAQRQVGGQKALTSADWDRVAADLKSYAMTQGIQTSETLLDYVIGNAVAANQGRTS